MLSKEGAGVNRADCGDRRRGDQAVTALNEHETHHLLLRPGAHNSGLRWLSEQIAPYPIG